MIRTLIAAESPVVRADLASLLGQSTAVTIVAVTVGDTLADDIESHEPDVVVVVADAHDERRVSTPGLSGLALSPDAQSRAPAIVLLVDDPRSRWVADAIRAGARGVVARNATPTEIIAAIEAAAAGLVAVPADVALAILSSDRPATALRPARESTQPLTARELEILGMLAEGLANKNIAARLGISEHTVKTHVAAILSKLVAYSRAEAVAIGVRRGLILL